MDMIISEATEFDGEDFVVDGFARYQFEVKNATNTGTCAVEFDFGQGYREMETIDLTGTSRGPYTIEAWPTRVRVTPSVEMGLTVKWSPVNLS